MPCDNLSCVSVTTMTALRNKLLGCDIRDREVVVLLWSMASDLFTNTIEQYYCLCRLTQLFIAQLNFLYEQFK